MKRESEIGIGKREKVGFKTRAKGGERRSSVDMRWKTVPQTSGRDRKLLRNSGQYMICNSFCVLGWL